MTDILSQLRGEIPHRLIEGHWTVDFEALDAERKEAADEIERLRKALKEIIQMDDDFVPETQNDYSNGWLVVAADVARTALEGK